MSQRLREIRSTAAGPLLLLLIYIGFFWKLTLTRQYTWLDSPDFTYQILPWFQMEATAFHHHTFPLWNPFEWGGQSMLGQMITGVANPLTWLISSMPLDHGVVSLFFLNWYFVLIHYLGGLFCYFLCRDCHLGLLASLFAGSAFGTAGWMGTTDWPQMLTGAMWAPLVFLFLLRAFPVGGAARDAGLAGACLGFALLSGHHQMPTFIALAAGAVWIWLLINHLRSGRWWEAARKVSFFVVFTALAGGLQTLPALEYGLTAVRWVSAPYPVDWKTPVPYFVHGMFSLAPSGLLGFVIPGVGGVTMPYLGWTVLSLALLGLASHWSDRAVKTFAGVALGGLLFSLGQINVFHGLLYALVPMVEKARSAGFAIFLFNFGAIVLAGFGLQRLTQPLQSFLWLHRAYRWLYAIAVFLALLTVARLVFASIPGIGQDSLFFVAITALLVASVFHALRAGRLSPHTAVVLLFLTALFELGNFTTVHYHHKDQPAGFLSKLGPEDDVAAFLRSRPEPVRIGVDMEAVPYNFGDWYGIDAVDQYTASMQRNIERIAFEYWARMLLAQNYAIGRKPPRQGGREVFTGQSGVNVYQIAEAFPRLWSVHQIAPLAREQDLAGELFTRQAALRSVVLLSGHQPPQLTVCDGDDTIGLQSRTLNHVRIETDMKCAGMVIASETFAPGWRAFVDGRPETVWPAYTFLRGVVVPAGKHSVEMVYRPTSVILGGAMTAMGVLGAALMLFRRRAPSDTLAKAL